MGGRECFKLSRYPLAVARSMTCAKSFMESEIAVMVGGRVIWAEQHQEDKAERPTMDAEHKGRGDDDDDDDGSGSG